MRTDLDRKRFGARCDHCGAPRKYGAEACRYCGRSLVVGQDGPVILMGRVPRLSRFGPKHLGRVETH